MEHRENMMGKVNLVKKVDRGGVEVYSTGGHGRLMVHLGLYCHLAVMTYI